MDFQKVLRQVDCHLEAMSTNQRFEAKMNDRFDDDSDDDLHNELLHNPPPMSSSEEDGVVVDICHIVVLQDRTDSLGTNVNLGRSGNLAVGTPDGVSIKIGAAWGFNDLHAFSASEQTSYFMRLAKCYNKAVGDISRLDRDRTYLIQNRRINRDFLLKQNQVILDLHLEICMFTYDNIVKWNEQQLPVSSMKNMISTRKKLASLKCQVKELEQQLRTKDSQLAAISRGEQPRSSLHGADCLQEQLLPLSTLQLSAAAETEPSGGRHLMTQACPLPNQGQQMLVQACPLPSQGHQRSTRVCPWPRAEQQPSRPVPPPRRRRPWQTTSPMSPTSSTMTITTEVSPGAPAPILVIYHPGGGASMQSMRSIVCAQNFQNFSDLTVPMGITTSPAIFAGKTDQSADKVTQPSQ